MPVTAPDPRLLEARALDRAVGELDRLLDELTEECRRLKARSRRLREAVADETEFRALQEDAERIVVPIERKARAG